jgi:transcriptional regulator with XRE-family HTH domain
MGFKENLKSELSYTGLQVKELAALSGVNKQTIDNYLSARHCMPPADTAVSLARALGVTVEYLVNGMENVTEEHLTTNREIRTITDILERLDDSERKTALRFVRWLEYNKGGGR